MRTSSLLLALALSLPILGLILAALLGQPSLMVEGGAVTGSTLSHLWNYVLTDYIVTTILLCLGV